jgi:hypothetical protein
MINNETTTTTTGDAMKFLAEAIPDIFPSINLLPTTPNEIKKIITSLKSKNSCGYDEISSKLLKYYVDYISVLLLFV